MNNPALVSLVAYALIEALAAGVKMAEIIQEAQRQGLESGRVPPEKWAELGAEFDAAKQGLEDAKRRRAGVTYQGHGSGTPQNTS